MLYIKFLNDKDVCIADFTASFALMFTVVFLNPHALMLSCTSKFGLGVGLGIISSVLVSV